MKLNTKLLAIIGKLNPQAFDAIFPHGPVIQKDVARLADFAGFSAKAMSPADAGAFAAQHFVTTQWTAQRMNIELDLDPKWWCPTGVPFKLPPFIFPPPPEPPQPDYMTGYFLGFASHLAIVAESLDREEAAGLSKAIDHAMGGLERIIG